MGSLDKASNTGISFEDYLGLMTCLVDWADSYDSKDWNRLRKCSAPTLRVRKKPSLTLCSNLPPLFLLLQHVSPTRILIPLTDRLPIFPIQAPRSDAGRRVP